MAVCMCISYTFLNGRKVQQNFVDILFTIRKRKTPLGYLWGGGVGNLKIRNRPILASKRSFRDVFTV